MGSNAAAFTTIERHVKYLFIIHSRERARERQRERTERDRERKREKKTEKESYFIFQYIGQSYLKKKKGGKKTNLGRCHFVSRENIKPP